MSNGSVMDQAFTSIRLTRVMEVDMTTRCFFAPPAADVFLGTSFPSASLYNRSCTCTVALMATKKFLRSSKVWLVGKSDASLISASIIDKWPALHHLSKLRFNSLRKKGKLL